MSYASKNPNMANGTACLEDNFKNGITNGAEWYELEGLYFLFNYLLHINNDFSSC